MENGGIDIVAIAKSRKFSSSFHNFIDKCLEKNPKSRYELSFLAFTVLLIFPLQPKNFR